MQYVRIFLIVFLLVGHELANHAHLLVVQFDRWRTLVQSHEVFGVRRVVKFLHAVVMQQIVLFLQLLESHLELRVLLLLLEI